jgi:hypothetical protein
MYNLIYNFKLDNKKLIITFNHTLDSLFAWITMHVLKRKFSSTPNIDI